MVQLDLSTPIETISPEEGRKISTQFTIEDFGTTILDPFASYPPHFSADLLSEHDHRRVVSVLNESMEAHFPVATWAFPAMFVLYLCLFPYAVWIFLVRKGLAHFNWIVIGVGIGGILVASYLQSYCRSKYDEAFAAVSKDLKEACDEIFLLKETKYLLERVSRSSGSVYLIIEVTIDPGAPLTPLQEAE
mmetsp:Transcript_29860/g.41250  ORF Transcript_29860/g.41250 Transcript_29860/m.41250 type:complete len:190 (+) Transcript_29860:81-650(+)